MTMTSRNVHWLRALNRQTNYPQALEKLKRWATTSNKQLPVNYERQATNSYGCKLADSCQLTYIKYLCLCAGSTCSDERRARPAASAPVVSHDIHQPVKSRRQAPVESQRSATCSHSHGRISECVSASPSGERHAPHAFSTSYFAQHLPPSLVAGSLPGQLRLNQVGREDIHKLAQLNLLLW